MIIIENQPSKDPIMNAIRDAFRNNMPVTLTIEINGKRIAIPAYMSSMIETNEPVTDLTITIESAGKPIEMI